jgi:hypothetical protein
MGGCFRFDPAVIRRACHAARSGGQRRGASQSGLPLVCRLGLEGKVPASPFRRTAKVAFMRAMLPATSPPDSPS